MEMCLFSPVFPSACLLSEQALVMLVEAYSVCRIMLNLHPVYWINDMLKIIMYVVNVCTSILKCICVYTYIYMNKH